MTGQVGSEGTYTITSMKRSLTYTKGFVWFTVLFVRIPRIAPNIIFYFNRGVVLRRSCSGKTIVQNNLFTKGAILKIRKKTKTSVVILEYILRPKG